MHSHAAPSAASTPTGAPRDNGSGKRNRTAGAVDSPTAGTTPVPPAHYRTTCRQPRPHRSHRVIRQWLGSSPPRPQTAKPPTPPLRPPSTHPNTGRRHRSHRHAVAPPSTATSVAAGSSMPPSRRPPVREPHQSHRCRGRCWAGCAGNRPKRRHSIARPPIRAGNSDDCRYRPRRNHRQLKHLQQLHSRLKYHRQQRSPLKYPPRNKAESVRGSWPIAPAAAQAGLPADFERTTHRVGPQPTDGFPVPAGRSHPDRRKGRRDQGLRRATATDR